MSDSNRRTVAKFRTAHPAVIRICHWAGAVAMVCMVMSGWQIYDASPIFDFVFPSWATLGGWLAGGIAWHFAAMWVLFASGLVYLGYGFGTRHFQRDIRPAGPQAVLRDLGLAATFRLRHPPGHYNAVQRLLYAGVIVVMLVSVLTGLSMYKPVQFAPLTWVFGDYPTARVIHFFAMSLIVAFLAIHLALVLLYPSTLVSMVTGGRRAPDAAGAEAAE